jgi:hypothetical protein
MLHNFAFVCPSVANYEPLDRVLRAYYNIGGHIQAAVFHLLGSLIITQLVFKSAGLKRRLDSGNM